MQLNRQQVQTILDNAPKGVDKTLILDNLVKSGYDLEGVDSNAVKTRLAQTTPMPTTQSTGINTPTFGERLKKDLTTAGDKIVDTNNSQEGSALKRGTEMTATAFNVIPQVAYEALPEPARKGLDFIGKQISRGFELLTDKVASTKLFSEVAQLEQQGFINKEKNPDLYKILDTLGTTSATGQIAGDILIADQGANALQKVTDITKNGVNSVIDSTSNVIGDVTNNPTNYPKQIVDTLSNKITQIEPKVKNVLDTTSIEKFNNYVKYGEEAIKDPRALTPLERAGNMVTERVLPTMKEDLSNIGKQLEKSISPIAKNQVKNATSDALALLTDGIKKYKLTPAESKLVQQAKSYLEIGKDPTVESISKTVDLLQNTLYEAKGNMALKVTPRVQAVVNQTIGKLNETLKTYVKENLQSPEYTKLNAEYSKRKFIFDKLNKSLGSDGMRGGSLVKRFFSPQDSGIKKMFSDIKELYGIDLGEDATLAKFVMDSLGDVRAKSLLEQVPLSKGGIVTKVLQKVEQKLTRPIEKARDIIKKRPQEGL